MSRFHRVASATFLAACALLAWQGAAHAQVFQPYWSAPPVPDDSPAMGAAAGFGDDMFRFAGHARFAITSASDLGLEVVFDNFEDEIGDDTQLFGFGGDFKYLAIPAGERLPFDFAVQGSFGMEFGESDFRSTTIPFGVLGSKSIPLEEGSRVVTPFAAAYLIVDDTNVSDADFNGEIRFGSAFQIVNRTHAFAALHTGNGTMFFLGFTAGL